MRTKGIGPNNLGMSPLKVKAIYQQKACQDLPTNLKKARINAARSCF